MDNITTLQSLFQRIEGLAKNPDTSKLINIPSTKELIQSISAELEEVFKGLIRILDPAQAGIEKKRRFRLWGSTQKLKWPLQKQEVEKTLQLLEQHKTALILAINSDQM